MSCFLYIFCSVANKGRKTTLQLAVSRSPACIEAGGTVVTALRAGNQNEMGLWGLAGWHKASGGFSL